MMGKLEKRCTECKFGNFGTESLHALHLKSQAKEVMGLKKVELCGKDIIKHKLLK